MDDWAAKADEPRGRAAPRPCRASRTTDGEAVAQLAELIDGASSPALVVGAGADDSETWERSSLSPSGSAVRSGRSPSAPGPGFPRTTALRRPPPGRPDAPAQDTGSARRRARRRRAGVPSVPLRCRPVRRGRNAGGDDQPGCSRGASKRRRARACSRIRRRCAPSSQQSWPRETARPAASGALPPLAPPAAGEPLLAGHVFAALAERLPRNAIVIEECPSNRPELSAASRRASRSAR